MPTNEKKEAVRRTSCYKEEVRFEEMGNTITRDYFCEALSACIFKCLGIDYSSSSRTSFNGHVCDETTSCQQPVPPLPPSTTTPESDPPPANNDESSSSTTDNDPQTGGEAAASILLLRQPTRPSVGTGGPPQTNQLDPI